MKTSESQKKATVKYLKTLTSISIRVKPEYATQIKQRANAKGLSLRAYILKLIDEDMQSSS